MNDPFLVDGFEPQNRLEIVVIKKSNIDTNTKNHSPTLLCTLYIKYKLILNFNFNFNFLDDVIS